MGLLDDAIREHLELKRRRGAEPGEIARLEREALEPGDDVVSTMLDEAQDDHADALLAGGEPGDPVCPGDPPGTHDGAAIAFDAASMPELHFAPAEMEPVQPTTTGQETVEIDMQAVLAEDADAGEADHGHDDRSDKAAVGESPRDAPVLPLGPAAAGPVDDTSALYSHQEEPLEWEGASTPSDAPAGELPPDSTHTVDEGFFE